MTDRCKAPARRVQRRARRLVSGCLAAWAFSVASPEATLLGQLPPPRPQNPSPMVEHTRSHDRIADAALPGLRFSLEGLLPQPVHVFVPAGVQPSRDATLLIHFHGSPHVAEHAVVAAARPYILAVVRVGAGTAAFERAFEKAETFDSLLVAITDRVRAATGSDVPFQRLVVSGFSAGHGAIRALLRNVRHFDRIDAALLLDGIHTGYLPDRQVLHEGGRLDSVLLAPYIELARAAIQGEKAVVITHSEVFPGTFASTTETADDMLNALGLRRQAVLEWGPVGMQQLSMVKAGRLLLLGFAGNSAPDHLDHVHGMDSFLRLLDEL